MPTETIVVTTPACTLCHRTSTLQVPAVGYHEWQAGEFIQVALPNLTADEREMLKTGTHPDCWDSIFPDED